MIPPRWNYAAVVATATRILQSVYLDSAQADGQDYAQEACATALQRGTPEPEWTTGHLVTLARYAILDAHRSRKRNTLQLFTMIDNMEDFHPAFAVEEDLDARLDAERELAAVYALARTDRNVRAVVLVAEGREYAEVAAMLDIPEGGIKGAVNRGRTLLRQRRAGVPAPRAYRRAPLAA